MDANEQEYVVIGYGGIGQRRVKDLQRRDYKIHAIADPDYTRIPKGEYTTYNDPEACLRECATARNVLICSPTEHQIGQATLAVDAGATGLMVEKPVGTSSDDIAKLRDDCKTMGVKAAAAYNFRCHPGVARLMTSKHQGVAPHILTLQASDRIVDWPTAKRFGENSYIFKEGIMRVSIPHAISITRLILGPVTSINAAKYMAVGNEPAVTVLAKHGDEGTASSTVVWGKRHYSVGHLIGTATCDPVDFLAFDGPADMHAVMLFAFNDWLEKDELPVGICTLDEAYEIMRTVEAAEAAIQLGVEQRL